MSNDPFLFYEVNKITGKSLGKDGEEAAISFLKEKGYQILEKNYRCRFGEIDIIAKDKEEIVFVEVKTRSSLIFGLPQEAVSYSKQLRLTRLALAYFSHHKLKDVPCRFDVVSILMEDKKLEKIQLITNAFPAAY